VFLVNESGTPVRREPSYNLPTLFQPPLAVVLGVHRAF
jgi:hypothetical protein